MGCIPATPVSPYILSGPTSNGWASLGSGLITLALSRYYPLLAGVVTYYKVFETTNQTAILRQIEFEEKAATSGDIKKTPLLIAVFQGSASVTTPTSGAVYNPSTTGLIGVVSIAEADYVRTSDTVWTAVAKPNLYIRSGGTSSSDADVKIVVLSDKATSVTYAAGAEGRLRLFAEQGTAL